MDNKILLSLCIPTYGVIEWVFPVLDSIYQQDVDLNLFEVVVTDNGKNQDFEEEIKYYIQKYKNLKYIKTNSYLFLNEIDAYKNASGIFVKFINHRTKLINGSINYFINFVKENEKEKPIIYFSNGALNNRKIKILNNFDEYIKELAIFSSWSTGMSFWKDHFDQINLECSFNELFPHTNILFDRKDEKKYIIDDNILLDEITLSHKNKGKYDVFYAFSVEFVDLILSLYKDKNISYSTFKHLKTQILYFVSDLYYDFVLRKKPCSYDVTNFENAINVFYSKKLVKKRVKFIFIKRLKNKIFRKRKNVKE